MARPDGRSLDSLRPVEMILGFHRPSEGSVLYRAGGTLVLCTASVDDKVPPFLEGKNQGWLTAEYQMHPRANPKRQDRDGRGKAPSGRTQEVQRLVGRALRAAVDLHKLGPRTVTIDCDVLEADGGTRTASITGGFVALAAALANIGACALREPVAATSVGYLEGIGPPGSSKSDAFHALDLCYVEDSRARVDLNVVATASGKIVEVQGTAEGEPVERREVDRMVDLALVGIDRLVQIQRDVLARAGIDLAKLTAAEVGR
jgi:ribonuclease PH